MNTLSENEASLPSRADKILKTIHYSHYQTSKVGFINLFCLVLFLIALITFDLFLYGYNNSEFKTFLFGLKSDQCGFAFSSFCCFENGQNVFIMDPPDFERI